MSFCEHFLPLSNYQNNFRFPGQYYDEETGFHYNYFRYYDPSTGRYLRADPIGLAGMDPNIYGYVLNNPVNLIDPYGLINFYLSGTFTIGFIDINSPKLSVSIPFLDGDKFGLSIDNKPNFGVSTALIGGSFNIATDNPFSFNDENCNQSLDKSYLYVGPRRHLATFSNLSGKNIGRSFGTGLSLPYVNASTSMDVAVQQLSDKIISPLIDKLSQGINKILN